VLILGILAWILVIPLIITIDSRRSFFELKWVSLGKVNVLLEPERIGFSIKVLFFKKIKYLNFFKQKAKKKEVEKPVKIKNKKKLKWSKINRKAKRVFNSFELKKLVLKLDTDDDYYNAFLFPVFYLSTINQHSKEKKIQLDINYQGINEIELVLKNRLIKIAFALLF
jgi:hypothetical protein